MAFHPLSPALDDESAIKIAREICPESIASPELLLKESNTQGQHHLVAQLTHQKRGER